MNLAELAKLAQALDAPPAPEPEHYGYLYNCRGWEHYTSMENLKHCHPQLSQDKIDTLIEKGTIRPNRMPPITNRP